MNREERKTLCKDEFNNCEIVIENKQLQSQLETANKKLEEIKKYVTEKLIYIDNCDDQETILSIIGDDRLNDEIEIIEEDKPIEKITIDLNYANHYSKANVKANGKYLAEKINELIDEVNKLKKESDK